MSWEVIATIRQNLSVCADLTADMVVSYTKENIVQIEEGHGRHDLSGIYYTIQYVKVYLGGEAIDITKMLTKNMEDEILQCLKDMEDDV